jgi:nucleoside-diphosphate-sugar epimerase
MTPTRSLRRSRLLIVGAGDIGMRCLAACNARYRVFALTRDPARRAALREAGAVPLVADLDDARSLARLIRLAPCVLHLAPPPAQGVIDTRTRALVSALGRGARASRLAANGANAPRRGFNGSGVIVPNAAWRAARIARASPVRLVYASTTGVYGDCGGATIDETRPARPGNARAVRRVDAERRLRDAGVRGALSVRILRIPGIYAGDRLPLARLRSGTPALDTAEDVYTNHIHADDLAAIVLRMLQRGRPQRVVHAVDDSDLRMGEYFDAVARAAGLPTPPRVSRAEAEKVLSPMLLSFMRESRRLSNRRLREELGTRLRYPTVAAFLAAWPGRAAAPA